MNIHKHPSLEIQECTERFLKRPDFSTLESLLQSCFSSGIAPPKLPLVLDEIESRKDSVLNCQLYDFIVNRLKKKDASVESSDNIQALTNAANNLIAHTPLNSSESKRSLYSRTKDFSNFFLPITRSKVDGGALSFIVATPFSNTLQIVCFFLHGRDFLSGFLLSENRFRQNAHRF